MERVRARGRSGGLIVIVTDERPVRGRIRRVSDLRARLERTHAAGARAGRRRFRRAGRWKAQEMPVLGELGLGPLVHAPATRVHEEVRNGRDFQAELGRDRKLLLFCWTAVLLKTR